MTLYTNKDHLPIRKAPVRVLFLLADAVEICGSVDWKCGIGEIAEKYHYIARKDKTFSFECSIIWITLLSMAEDVISDV